MLSNKKLFLLDIDGTVCVGSQLINGAYEFLKDINECGGKYVFITNNTTKSIADYVESFKKLGVECDSSNFITASYVTIKHLNENYRGKLIYVLGTQSFINELVKNGVNVTTDCNADNIECVLVSYNNELTYKGISDVCRILSTRNVDYLATNPDMVCPIEFGFVPDCGAICQMIGLAVSRKPHFIGKPETDMVNCAIEQNGYTKEETLVVGDKIYTDILCGYRAKVDTGLVLTGEAKEEDIANYDYKADYIFSDIKALHKKWKN